MYRLDRTAFHMGKAEDESLRQARYWHSKSPQERLNAMYYLLCQLYGDEKGNLPRLDKTKFSMRKHRH